MMKRFHNIFVTARRCACFFALDYCILQNNNLNIVSKFFDKKAMCEAPSKGQFNVNKLSVVSNQNHQEKTKIFYPFFRKFISNFSTNKLNDTMIQLIVERNINERRLDLEQSINNNEKNEFFPKTQLDWDSIKRKWNKDLHIIHKLSGEKTSTGNRLTLLVDDAIIVCLLDAINKATTRVWLETYIFDSSPVGEQFVKALIASKQRGVDATLIVDWLGAFDMPSEWVQQLRNAGVQVIIFNNWQHVTFRDHRKLAVIDNIGFCGSANISADAASRDIGGTGRFFDLHVKVEGPAVAHIADVFRDSLAGMSIFKSRLFPIPPPIPIDEGGGTLVQILESNASRKQRSIQSVYNRVILNASESINATTGYFCPPTLLRRSLKAAALRGVPINLILSGNSDVWGDVYSATFSVMKLMKTHSILKNVPRVWFSQDRHCHAKSVIVDGVWSSIGSFNWDRHSGRRNLEVAVSCFDTRFAKEIQNVYNGMIYNKNYSNSDLKPVTKQEPTEILFQDSVKSTESYIQKIWKLLISTDSYKSNIIRTLCLPINENNLSIIPTNKNPARHFYHQNNRSIYGIADPPKTIEMTLNDCNQFSTLRLTLMRIAAWLIQTSGSSMFDSFEDIDKHAQLEATQKKWKQWTDRAELFFSFGPSVESLKMFSGCIV